jgi:hypothetical protein
MAFSQAGEDAENQWDQQDAQERQVLANRHRALKLNPEWYENADQMMEDINGRKEATQQQIQERVTGQQAARRSRNASHEGYAATPMEQHYSDFVNQFGPAAQGRALQGAIDATSGAIQDENDSRVAQEREARRMQHEKDLESMRQQALIQRLQMEHDQTMKAMAMQSGGATTRRFNPNTLSWDIV